MKLTNITKKYGEKTIFENFSVEFEENKITAVMGGSGTGKSTLINIIAGLTAYDGVFVKDGDISCVFGEPALLPNLTVRGNLDYAVAHKIKDKAVRKKSIDDILAAVELTESADSYPNELSTGMAQRVAMARSFLYPSKYILLDEAFRGLDTILKTKLERYFLKLLNDSPRTVVMITHDLTEALMLADRLILIKGRPADISLDMSVPGEKSFRKLSDAALVAVGEAYMREADLDNTGKFCKSN